MLGLNAVVILHVAGGEKLPGNGLYEVLLQRFVDDPGAVRVIVVVAVPDTKDPLEIGLLKPNPM